MLDYSESRSSFSFSFGAITAVSLPGFLTQFGVLRAALAGITVGTISYEKWVGDEAILSNIPPTNSNAQREMCWRMAYENGTGLFSKEYTLRIATPDTSLLGTDGNDEADYSNPLIAAFITAFETLATTPDGQPIYVVSIDLEGRRY